MSVLAEQIAEQIIGFLQRRKLSPAFSQERMAKQIMDYMDLRRRGSALTISHPQFKIKNPDGWSEHDEEVWQDWFSNEIHLSEWLREVFRPVFGLNTSACSWDYTCDGWRDELIAFLPWWAQRSVTLVASYDATPYEEEGDDTIFDPYNASVDPYLVDHGSRRTKTKS